MDEVGQALTESKRGQARKPVGALEAVDFILSKVNGLKTRPGPRRKRQLAREGWLVSETEVSPVRIGEVDRSFKRIPGDAQPEEAHQTKKRADIGDGVVVELELAEMTQAGEL